MIVMMIWTDSQARDQARCGNLTAIGVTIFVRKVVACGELDWRS